MIHEYFDVIKLEPTRSSQGEVTLLPRMQPKPALFSRVREMLFGRRAQAGAAPEAPAEKSDETTAIESAVPVPETIALETAAIESTIPAIESIAPETLAVPAPAPVPSATEEHTPSTHYSIQRARQKRGRKAGEKKEKDGLIDFLIKQIAVCVAILLLFAVINLLGFSSLLRGTREIVRLQGTRTFTVNAEYL